MAIRTKYHNVTFFGIITLLLVTIILRYPFSDFPPINPDDCANASQALQIAKYGYIPYLLHPVLSFIGIYPASDTSGIMVVEASMFALVPAPSMIYTNLFVSMILSCLITLAAFLLGREFIKHPLCQLIPPLAIVLPQYLLRDLQYFAVGSRALAFCFLILFYVTYMKFLKSDWKNRKKLFFLLMLFGTGGICSHLTFLYYAPFVIFPPVLLILIKKVYPFVLKVDVFIKLFQKKWGGYVLFALIVVLYLLPFYGYSIFPYAKTLPQLMTFQFVGFGENVYVAFIWTYIAYYGLFFGLGLFGIFALCFYKTSGAKQYLLITAIFMSQVYIDLIYFIIVFTIFLSIFAGIGAEYFLRKNSKLISIILLASTLPSLMVFAVYTYRYAYIELAIYAFFVFLVLVSGYFYWRQRISLKNLKTVSTVFVVVIVILSPAFSICSYNYDFSQRIKGQLVYNPVIRTDADTISNSLYLKNTDNERFAILSHAPYYGTHLVISQTYSAHDMGSLMHVAKIKENVQVNSVEWSIQRPKTFFEGKINIGGRDIPLITSYDWLIYQSDISTARELAHIAGVYYISEYIPCAGKVYHTFPPYKFFDSQLLNQKNNYLYCIYQNSVYRDYYI